MSSSRIGLLLLIPLTRARSISDLFDALTSKHGEDNDFDLTPAQIIEVIKGGDPSSRKIL
jgi:hypothetical protein